MEESRGAARLHAPALVVGALIQPQYVSITLDGKVRITIRGGGKRAELELAWEHACRLTDELMEACTRIQRDRIRMGEQAKVLRELEGGH